MDGIGELAREEYAGMKRDRDGKGGKERRRKDDDDDYEDEDDGEMTTGNSKMSHSPLK